jgi:hypothetical protein
VTGIIPASDLEGFHAVRGERIKSSLADAGILLDAD